MADPHPPRPRRRYRIEIVEYLDGEEAARESHAISARRLEDVRRVLAQAEAS